MELLTEYQAAEILQLRVTTLRRWRFNKQGPIYLKLGRAVRYQKDDLVQWFEQSKVTTKHVR